MSWFVKLFKQFEPYSRPNSFISYLDIILAIIIFILIKKLRWLSPNILTTFSLILWLVAIFGYIFYGWRYICVVLLLFSYTFDNLDGIWARYFNQTSNFGAWYDSACDRVKDIFILCAFIYLFHETFLFLFFLLALFLFFVSISLESESRRYFKPYSTEKIKMAIQKKFRLLAFGPAESLVFYSLIILLPVAYKIIPISFFYLVMILIFYKIRRTYEFV